MYRVSPIVVFFALVLTVLPGSPLVALAAAQCSEVNEFVEMWDDSEEYNDTVGLYARGIAEAGEGPCNLTIRTYIVGPDNTERASTYGYGSYIASSNVAVYFDEYSTDEGNYSGKTEAWSGQVHFGCSFMVIPISMFSANYERTQAGNTFCAYWRCAPGGTCMSMSTVKSKMPGGVCVPFARLAIAYIGYPSPAIGVCASFGELAISSCAG